MGQPRARALWLRIVGAVVAVVAALVTAGAFAVSGRGTLSTTAGPAHSSSAEARATPPTATRRHALAAYGRLPLAFVANAGQLDRQVRYSSQAGGASFFFTRSEAVVALAKGRRGLALQLRFLGAEPRPALSAVKPGPDRVSYLLGNKPARWRRNLASYQRLVYRRLWPGVALRLHGGGGRLEYEFRLRPEADPARIRLAYRGQRRLALGPGGELRIDTALGSLRDLRPRSYQQIRGQRVPVSSRFVLGRNSSYGFALGAYNHRYPLVIDPGLVYSTYLPGNGLDAGIGIAVDAAGSAYVTGETRATDFPTTPGAFQTSYGGGNGDAFVSKLNPSGTALAYSTYLGGNGEDGGLGIAVDAAGHAYVTGSTASSDFPTTAGAFQTSKLTSGNESDAFVSKLNPSGTALAYSSYLGGSQPDWGRGIAVDSAGSAYVTGSTASFSDFPTTAGAFQTSYGGGTPGEDPDAFVSKLNPTGTALAYSTYLGGNGKDAGIGIAVDAAGHAYVTGQAASDFPTTTGSFQTSYHGGTEDAFVSKLNPTGTALAYSTYLGGTDFDTGIGITIDAAGHAYVTGQAASDFPTTTGSFQTSYHGGHEDAFVSKLNPTGTALAYSTYLGGKGVDGGFGIAVDGAGSAYITGETSSSDFPTTAGSFQTNNGGNGDAFVSKLNPSGTALAYSTYLGGGKGEDGGWGIALDSAGHAYVTGHTGSTDFPTTAGAFQTSYGGVFVSKLDLIAAKAGVVPNVKGKTLKAAEQAIKAHNFRVGKITHAFSRNVKKGHVISQKPKAGKLLTNGAKVNLKVSKGRR